MKLSTRDMILIGAFASLAAVGAIAVRFGGQAIVPFSPIPLVATAAGLMLGARKGALAMLVYVLIGLAGVPVFAKAPFGGPQYFLQPTFGFLLGFIAAAFAAGAILGWNRRRGLPAYLAASLCGVAAVYAVGLPYLWAMLNFVVAPGALAQIGMSQPVSAITVVKIGMVPYVALDLGKAVMAALLSRQVAQRLP
ncbi:MAG: biotin transporter BioY [Actinobacteria bacterium]|nr:MAG: biotin transporter BioY [Actinomycetota bacterium]